MSLRPMQLIYSFVVRGRLHHGHLCPSPAVLVGLSNPDSTSSVPMILYYICFVWRTLDKLSEFAARFQTTEEGAGCAATPPPQVTSTVPAVSTASSGLFTLQEMLRTFCIEPRATNVCATLCAHESATWSFVIPRDKNILLPLATCTSCTVQDSRALHVPFLSFFLL